MTLPWRRLSRSLLALAATALWLCRPWGAAIAGSFPEVERIESELERGVSNRQDVRRLLGTPDGFGTSMFPPDHRLHDLWYYEDLEVAGMQAVGGGWQEVTLRQQLLFVFFDGDRYDGFSWTSNLIPAQAR